MSKLIPLTVLIVLLVGIPLAAAHHNPAHRAAQAGSGGTGGESPGGVSEVLGSGGSGGETGSEPIYKTLSSGTELNEPVPIAIEAAAKKHVISLVGEEYFNSRFTFDVKKAFQYKGAKFYNVHYKFDVPSEFIASPEIEIATVSLDSNGKVIGYEGPGKAYGFLITREQAIAIGKEEGLENPGAVIDRILIEKLLSYAWIVTGTQKKDCRPVGTGRECFIPGVYIDVDSGKVLGSFGKSVLIEAAAAGTIVKEDLPLTLIAGIVILHVIILSVYYLKKK